MKMFYKYYGKRYRMCMYEEESENVSHLEFRTDNESIYKSVMSTFSGSTSIR